MRIGITLGGLLGALLLAAALPALGQPAPPPDPEATVVADLVVVAPANGPAWWKVSKGDSVVWILGLPPGPTPRNLKWDTSTLTRRLKGARAMIMPTGDWSGFAEGLHKLPVLAPPLAHRVEAASVLLDAPLNDREFASAASVIYLRTAYYRHNRLSDDVRTDVAAVARRARVPITAAQQHRYYWTLADVDPADPIMAGCIDAILKDVVIDPALYHQAAQAWATGDVPTVIAKTPRGVCQHLVAGQRERAVSFAVQAISDALKTPGKTVAALHIRQLVSEDGVLSRLRAGGYTISDPSRPLEE